MDRNTITGMLLIGLILIGYSLWLKPDEQPIKKSAGQTTEERQDEPGVEGEIPTIAPESAEQTGNASNAAVDVENATAPSEEDSLRALLQRKQYGAFAEALEGEEQLHKLSSGAYEVWLSNKGAAPVQAALRHYLTYGGDSLYLFDRKTSRYSFNFWLSNSREVSSDEFYFTPVEAGDNRVVYRLNGSGENQFLEVSYWIEEGDTNRLHSSIRVEGMPQLLDASDDLFELDWSIMAPVHERSREQEQQKTTVYYKYKDDSPDYISERDYEKELLKATTHWVSFKEQFFSAAIISDEGFSHENAEVETIETTDERYTKGLRAHVGIEMKGTNRADFAFYFGPNHYQTLASYDIGLEDQIDLGWGIFGWVNKFLVIPTFNFLDKHTNLSYGIIILILTILIKLILFPLTWKNYVSSARMRVLKPEVDEINEKMKDKDPMTKQQAVMELYRKAGVNPMAGCVPMLLQIPILYAMFRFFPASIELRQESFLWADDLSTYDAIYTWSTHIPIISTYYGNHISLFTLLMALSTFFYSKYNMDMAGGGNSQMPQMKVMIYIMPFMLLFFFNSYSSGLSYYYFTANVLSMLQQFVIKKYFIDEEAIHRKIQENKKKPAKKSSFQQRLEKMAREKGANQKQRKR